MEIKYYKQCHKYMVFKSTHSQTYSTHSSREKQTKKKNNVQTQFVSAWHWPRKAPCHVRSNTHNNGNIASKKKQKQINRLSAAKWRKRRRMNPSIPPERMRIDTQQNERYGHERLNFCAHHNKIYRYIECNESVERSNIFDRFIQFAFRIYFFLLLLHGFVCLSTMEYDCKHIRIDGGVFFSLHRNNNKDCGFFLPMNYFVVLLFLSQIFAWNSSGFFSAYISWCWRYGVVIISSFGHVHLKCQTLVNAYQQMQYDPL